MEKNNRKKGKVVGWKLNSKGKKNLENFFLACVGLSLLGYFLMGVWLLYFVLVGGNVY